MSLFPREGEPSRPARKGWAPGISFALAAAALLSGACRRADPRDVSLSEASVADTPHVGPDEETFFTDLPGVDGFDALTAEQQAAVTARANRAKCDCGCFGHSISACLHQKEACEIAERLASQFVADAALGEALAMGEPGAAAADATGPAAGVEAAPPAEAGDENPVAAAGGETPPAAPEDETTPEPAGDPATPAETGEPATNAAGSSGLPAPAAPPPEPETPRNP